MGIVSGLIDRSVLVGGVLVGGMVPGFVVQYKQRLGGALDQVLKDLKPFQEIAKQFHNGSLDALIRHHLNSSDATFRDEGAGIAKMVENAKHLNEAVQAMQGNLLHQIKYLARHADAEMLQATWAAFTPAFSFTLDGLMVAGAVGFSLWAVVMLLIAILRRLPRRPRQWEQKPSGSFFKSR